MAFDFIKKLFPKKEQEIQSEEVPIINLKNWLDEKSQTKKQSLNKDLAVLFSTISNLATDVRIQLEVLGKAELANKKIEQRLIQIMEGNREAYIKKVRQFVEETLVPEDITVENAKDYAENFNRLALALNKSTAKPYFVLQDFFRNESSKVAGLLKKMDEAVKKVNELITLNNLDKVAKAERDVIDLAAKVSIIDDLNKRVEELEKNKKENIMNKEQAMSGIQKLKESEDYAMFQNIQEKIEAVTKNIKSEQSQITDFFSVLDQALRKYERIAVENLDLIHSYIISVPETLLKDKDFRILAILDKVKANILNNSIELKDKKREKALKRIKEINKEGIKTFADKINNLYEKKGELIKHMNRLGVARDYNELIYRSEHFSNRLKRTEEDLGAAKKALEKLDIENFKKQVEKQLFEVTGINVSVRID